MIFTAIQSPEIVRPLTHQVSVCLNTEKTKPDGLDEDLPLSDCRLQLDQRRRAQYLAGRHCMNEAIKAACSSGGPYSTAGLRFSEMMLASSTQTGSYVSAAVTLRDQTKLFGIDSELVFTDEALARLWPVVLTKREVANFEWDYKQLLSRHEYISLAFSAKQSLMKAFSALKPPTDVHYQDLLITLDPNHDKNFRFELLKSLSQSFPKGFSDLGHYDFSYDHVHTAIDLPA